MKNQKRFIAACLLSLLGAALVSCAPDGSSNASSERSDSSIAESSFDEISSSGTFDSSDSSAPATSEPTPSSPEELPENLLHYGHGQPIEEKGMPGDGYLDLDNRNYYLKGEEGWEFAGNLNGEQGKSAYDLYVEEFPGYTWGRQQWLRDLASGALNVVVTFDADGGTPIAPAVYCKGEEVKIDQIPEKEHGAFAGWYEDEDCLIPAKTSFLAEESLTLFAKFDYEEATAVFMDQGAIYESVSSSFFGKIEAPEDPEALGFSFQGWKRVDEDELYDFNRVLTEETTVFESVYDYDFLELPAVIINTEDQTEITSKEEYLTSTVSIKNTKEEWQLSDVSASVKGRGNTSWAMEKKPYRIKFDKKQSVLGSAYKAKSWTLIANHSDKSLSRNYLAYEMGKLFDGLDFSSFHEFVEVYINGTYRGVYLLCDHLQVGEGRVPIDEKVAEDGNNGFFLERDARAAEEGEENVAWFKAGGEPYVIKSPDVESESYLANSEAEIAYIRSYLETCKSTILNPELPWADVDALIDVDSFVDSYLADELFANNDCGFSSCYFYKPQGGKLFKGPLWDFDIAAGNINYNMGNEEDCPCDERLWANTACTWYKWLLSRPEFVALVQEKLISYKETILGIIDLADTAKEGSLYQTYGQALERNFVRWDVMGKNVWNNPNSVNEIDTLSGQFAYLYDWLLGRYRYVWQQYLGTDTPFDENEPEPEPEAYKATFAWDDGVEKVIVYATSDYENGAKEEAAIAYSRDSATGDFLKDGSGQINFEVVLKPGYQLNSVTAEGSYKNLKLPTDTGKENTYRITKVASDLTIAITTIVGE